MEQLFNEKECTYCKKRFIVPDAGTWVYKQKTYTGKDGPKLCYFCSWRCLNTWRSNRMVDYSRKKPAL